MLLFQTVTPLKKVLHDPQTAKASVVSLMFVFLHFIFTKSQFIPSNLQHT